MIILGTAHLGSTPGKCSPDGLLREAVYSRERCEVIKAILDGYGYRSVIDYEPLDPKPAWTEARKKAGWKAEQQRELEYRVKRVNDLCSRYGKDFCLYVSLHLNGIGTDGKWHDDVRGWSVWTSPGQTQGDILATCLWEAADRLLPHDHKNALRADYSDSDPDYEANLYVLRHTQCAAALTENFFQDSRLDAEYLQSEAGMTAIERLHVEGIINYIEKR